MLSKQHGQYEDVVRYQSPHRPSLDSAASGREQVRDPLTTFTALLQAAQSVDVDTFSSLSTAKTSATSSSQSDRRLRNRISCRKSRLKRKLQQHDLDVLVRERQERHEYLTQVSNTIRIMERDGTCSSARRDTLFRELATRSLHYALVDPAYAGWLHDDVGSHARRSSKRLRSAHNSDVSTGSFPSPQAAMFEQWRAIVDGLQSLELKLLHQDENALPRGAFEHVCSWRLIGVVSARVERDSEIAAVAVSGSTRVRFNGRQVQEVSVSVVQREQNVPFDVSPRSHHHDNSDGS